jgi:hypothetical protein
MVFPVPPTAGALTGAGYTLTAGVYSKTFGTFTVNFNISQEPGGGLLTVVPNGDISAADIASVNVSLGSLGYSVGPAPLTAAGGLTVYSQSL